MGSKYSRTWPLQIVRLNINDWLNLDYKDHPHFLPHNIINLHCLADNGYLRRNLHIFPGHSALEVASLKVRGALSISAASSNLHMGISKGFQFVSRGLFICKWLASLVMPGQLFMISRQIVAIPMRILEFWVVCSQLEEMFKISYAEYSI